MSRITATLALTFAALASTVPAAPAVSPAVSPAPDGDHLTVTVAHTGDPALDGTYELYCHPAAGDHPDPRAACARLDKATGWGKDPFAPVPPNTPCTKQYGGPATAHVTGRWAGRPVDARYDRTDGCEISRWNDLEPFLPATNSVR
ncbi:hypothetical protein GCM10009801_50090 [Streptomyces albiaxialis]|uniref:Subtilisin inhibitor domain-containing protein n=1 Tax=Streptomyces albiaxialis TaxID=329523 RepID=A0ABN2W9R2_9ACTN